MIAAARKDELAGAVAQVRQLVAEYGLTEQDIFSVQRGARPGTKVAPKYRDPQNPENTWTGRGKAPSWIADVPKDQRAAYEI